MDINEFKLDLQAVLEKAKSILNIKRDIKIIEEKLPKIKLQGTLNKTAVKKELNSKLKSVNPKVKIDADVTVADKKLKRLGQQKSNPTITPAVDNTQVVSGIQEAQKETKTLWERFTNGIFGINLIRMGVQEVVQAVRQAITNIKELDAIKTNIQMVSGTSDSGVNAMMNSYNDMAKDLSSTTKEVGEAANEFLRMGESVASTNKLIKSSQILSKVGMIESADSASYLISSLKGYKIAAENSMNVVSKLTSVDLEAAVSAGGLAEALSKCSNIANNSGVTMDRLIGYTATVGEVTQKSMSEVGNSFQSILSRMNNIKIGRFIDDETGESLSDTEAVLNRLGIQLRDTEDSYRSFDDVLDDIGSRWKDFTKVEQNAISVAIAGTRQRENFEALMNNYGEALKYSETAANSAGSALERYGIYQDSIQAKTNELTAAMESLSTNVISEELFSGIIEATTGVVEFVDKTNILKGTLAGIVTMGISKAFVSMATGIISASKSTAQLTAAMALFDKGRSKQNLLDIGAACKGLSNQQLKLVLSTKGLTDTQRKAILTGMSVEEAEQKQILTTLGFAEAENIATASTFSFKGALNVLKVAIASNPVGAIITGITTTVTVATMAFSHFKQAEEELIQSTQESANAYKESVSTIDDYVSRYQELHKALLEAKGNEEETYNIKKQLLDLQTELNDKFGEEYGKLNLVTDAYRDQTEAIKALNKETAQTFLNENKEGIDKSVKEMTKDRRYNLSYTGMSSYTDDGAALKEIAEKYKDKGIWINEDTSTGTYNLILDADAQSAYDTINAFENEIREKAKELGDEHIFDDVLEISSSELNRAKETIEKYGDTYRQALTAEIVSDDSKSAAYSKALQAVEAYNEAVLNSESPYDDQNVMQAKENLDTIKNSIQSNEEELGKYSILFDDVFDQADTRLIDFDEAIKNDSGLQELAKDLEGLSNLDLQALNENVGENNSFDKLKEEAGKYKLNVEELINTLIRLGYVQGEIQNTVPDTAEQSIAPTISSSVQQLATQLEPQFAKLSEAYKAIFQIDEKTGTESFSLDDVDNSMLEGLRKSFAEIEEEIGVAFDASILNPFFDTLTNGSSTAEQVQQAFNDLATAYFYSTETLEQLNEETAESIAKQLEEMGVVNAQEVVYDELNAKTEALALQKKILAETGIDVLNASNDVVYGLLNEAGASETARLYLFNLVAQEQIFNNNALDTSGKVAKLQELATAYGQTAVAARIAAMQEMYANNHMPVDNANILAAAQAEISNAISNVKIDFKGAGSGKKSGSKSKTKEEKDTTKEYDWIEQAIENVEKEIKELDEVADSSYSTFSQKNEALTKEIGKVTEEIELQQKAYEEYMRKADSIGLPDSYKELVQNGAINIEDIKDEKLQEQIEGYQKWYDKAQNASDAIKELKTDLKDLHVESYKLQTENLKDRLDSDSITEKQYLAGLKSAYEQFYGNLEDYAEQYHEAKLEYLEEEKKYLNSVANAAASLLDVEIDRIQENADEQEEQLKGQIELLEARKKPLQDELEALDDKVRKEGLALNLQKAQYDLARAENQRSKLIYTKDKGIIFTNDSKAIRDAEKDVDDAKLEIHKQSIQDQIDVLDDEISRYDELIDQINKAADAQVKALEKIKNKWQEVIDQQEYAKNVTILTGEFGSDAIVKILSGNDDDLLAQWKNSYINTLKSIDSESQGYIGDMTKQIESLYKNQASAVTNVVSNVNNTVDKSVNTIKGEITLPDGTVIRPIEPGDRAWELQKAFEPLVNKILNGETDIVNSALFEHQRQMEQWTKNLTYSNVMNNVTNNKNMQPVINIGDITVQGVQDVNGFARAVKAYFPNTMLQEMHKR